jgi:hypothetical protein
MEEPIFQSNHQKRFDLEQEESQLIICQKKQYLEQVHYLP